MLFGHIFAPPPGPGVGGDQTEKYTPLESSLTKIEHIPDRGVFDIRDHEVSHGVIGVVRVSVEE